MPSRSPGKLGMRQGVTGGRAGSGRRRIVAALVFALTFSLMASQEAAALSPHERTGVMLGAAVGYSPGKVKLFPGSEEYAVESGWEMGVSPQIRIGYPLIKNRLLVTVANQQWLYEQGILAEDKLRINSQNWTLALTYFPCNPQSEAGGLYLLAGIGYANARLTLLEPIEDDPYGNKFEEVFKEDETGTSYQVGAGFEFRFTTSFAAGLSVSYIHQVMDGQIFDTTTAVPVDLTLSWYF